MCLQAVSEFVSKTRMWYPLRVASQNRLLEWMSTITSPTEMVIALNLSVNKNKSKDSFFGSLSTIVGDLSLTSRENQIVSLYFDVQSDENFSFKVLEVSKIESLTLDVLAEFVSGF